jgi:hypothetical protein
MSHLLPLSNRPSISALIDDNDIALVSLYHWRLNSGGYVVTNAQVNGKRKTLYLHRLLMAAAPGQLVDHINRDKLDNRRENLRFVTAQQNNRNRQLSRRSKAGFVGVSVGHSCYGAHLRVNGKTIRLGTYRDAEIAALVRDAYARRIDPDHFHLNFPDRPTPPEIEQLLDQVLAGIRPPRSRRPKPASLGKSQYRGVYSKRGRWRAKISVNGNTRHLGYFDNERVAAEAYDRAAIRLKGSAARLNFPPRVETA